MNGARVFKLLMLVIGIIIVNIVVLSPGLIGAKLMGGSAIATSAVATLLIMSLITLLVGSHALLFRPPLSRQHSPPLNHEQFELALIRHRGMRTLRQETELALSQLERMEKKKQALLQLLGERFNQSEMSYRRFISVVAAVEELFYGHIRGFINLLHLKQSAAMSAGVAAEASGYLGANEEILLKLDQLLSELSRLGSANYRDALGMPCMKDIDALISQTKYYKP
ncbi:hypothetical protein ACX1C1_11520 [Paenibacillus sp. strain BS8-2]